MGSKAGMIVAVVIGSVVLVAVIASVVVGVVIWKKKDDEDEDENGIPNKVEIGKLTSNGKMMHLCSVEDGQYIIPGKVVEGENKCLYPNNGKEKSSKDYVLIKPSGKYEWTKTQPKKPFVVGIDPVCRGYPVVGHGEFHVGKMIPDANGTKICYIAYGGKERIVTDFESLGYV